MSIEDLYYNDVPEYYPSMYLDGYTPEQIKYAHKMKTMEELDSKSQITKLKIISEVRVK